MEHTFVLDLNGKRFRLFRPEFEKLLPIVSPSAVLVVNPLTNAKEYLLNRHAGCFGAVLDYLQVRQGCHSHSLTFHKGFIGCVW